MYLEINPTLSSFYTPASESKNIVFLLKILSLHLISVAAIAARRRKKRLADEDISKMAFKKASLKPCFCAAEVSRDLTEGNEYGGVKIMISKVEFHCAQEAETLLNLRER